MLPQHPNGKYIVLILMLFSLLSALLLIMHYLRLAEGGGEVLWPISHILRDHLSLMKTNYLNRWYEKCCFSWKVQKFMLVYRISFIFTWGLPAFIFAGNTYSIALCTKSILFSSFLPSLFILLFVSCPFTTANYLSLQVPPSSLPQICYKQAYLLGLIKYSTFLFCLSRKIRGNQKRKVERIIQPTDLFTSNSE